MTFPEPPHRDDQSELASPSAPKPRRGAGWAILCGGLFAGAFDLTFACFYYGGGSPKPIRIMQSVAGGLYGKATFEGGLRTAAVGFICHFAIAFGVAAAYVGASKKLPVLLRHPVPLGLLYGAAVFFFMNMVVLPLSAYHRAAFPPPLAPWPIAAHMIGIGLPVALIARAAARS